MKSQYKYCRWNKAMFSAASGLFLYGCCNALYLTVFSLCCWEGRVLWAGLLAGAWILPGALTAFLELWRDSLQPTPASVVRVVVLLLCQPVYLLYRGIGALGRGVNSPEWGVALYWRWGAVVGGAPVAVLVSGTLFLSDWGRLNQGGVGVWLQGATILVGLVDLALSGVGWRGLERESDPIIWYRPREESGRKGSFLDRVLEVVSTVLQVPCAIVTIARFNKTNLFSVG